jgi:hypothetical protein
MAKWHFQFNIDVDALNQLVHVKIYGIWREDTALNYHEDFKREVAPITDKPWARLVDLSNWKTASDEVVAVIAEHIQWCVDNNCAYAAYVIDNPITYGQLMRMIEKGQAKETSKTFRTKAEAEKFLQEQGFAIGTSTDDKTIFK